MLREEVRYEEVSQARPYAVGMTLHNRTAPIYTHIRPFQALHDTQLDIFYPWRLMGFFMEEVGFPVYWTLLLAIVSTCNWVVSKATRNKLRKLFVSQGSDDISIRVLFASSSSKQCACLFRGGEQLHQYMWCQHMCTSVSHITVAMMPVLKGRFRNSS